MKTFLLACSLLFGLCTQAATNTFLVVVEQSIYSRLTNFPAYVENRAAAGWDVQVRPWDSQIGAQANYSSFAARRLATNIVWPIVESGCRHILFVGDGLPIPVSGLSICPDGHQSSTNFDGWRGVQNSAGAYTAIQFYGCPAPFQTWGTAAWTDVSAASLSITLRRQNGIGDGRFDNEWLPVKGKAAVGWIGHYGEIGEDAGGLTRRALVIDRYFKRLLDYYNGNWSLVGAANQFIENFDDPHVSNLMWDRMKTIYGTNAVDDIEHRLTGAALTNRPSGFEIIYTGSDWLSGLAESFRRPIGAVQFIHLSFAKELPNGSSGNAVSKPFTAVSPNNPLIMIPWNPGTRMDINVLNNGGTVGEMYIECYDRLSKFPTWLGLGGDPTLRLFRTQATVIRSTSAPRSFKAVENQ